MGEFLPLTQPSGNQAGKRVLPSVSSLGVSPIGSMRISLVTLVIIAVAVFVVWKFVLKK